MTRKIRNTGRAIDVSAHLEKLKRTLGEVPGLAAVYLYGSYGTPFQTPLSDIDIALIFSEENEPSSAQYAGLIDPEWREGYRRRGIDPDRMLDLAIEMDNALIAGHPGVTFGLHVCRGNNQSKYFGRGDYAPIAKKLFAGTRFQRFLLEYDDERSGDFEPLRFVPEDRTVVLGLVTTKHGRLEERRALAARIREAARLVPLERLALSPQCGFASTFEGNLLSPQEQEAKLRRVAETAAEIWSRG